MTRCNAHQGVDPEVFCDRTFFRIDARLITCPAIFPRLVCRGNPALAVSYPLDLRVNHAFIIPVRTTPWKNQPRRNSRGPAEALPVDSARDATARKSLHDMRKCAKARRWILHSSGETISHQCPMHIRLFPARYSRGVVHDKWLAVTDLGSIVRDGLRVTDLADPSWLLPCALGSKACRRDGIDPKDGAVSHTSRNRTNHSGSLPATYVR